MVMVRVTPTEVVVHCDPFDGRPDTVEVQDELMPVLSIDRVREESAAYRVEIGPRTIFDVSTPRTRLRLAFQHRRRRWLVEGLEPIALPARIAA